MHCSPATGHFKTLYTGYTFVGTIKSWYYKYYDTYNVVWEDEKSLYMYLNGCDHFV